MNWAIRAMNVEYKGMIPVVRNNAGLNVCHGEEELTGEEKIRTILNRVPDYIVSVNDGELKSIQARTLLVVGDHDDSFDPGCVLNAKKHIPDSFLWIVPNTSHSAHKYDN